MGFNANLVAWQDDVVSFVVPQLEKKRGDQ